MRKSLLGIITLLSAASVHGQTVTDSLNFTGAMQTWTVPCGVTSVIVECYGAQGGAGAVGGIGAQGGTGGRGAYSMGTLAVSPGDVLNIFVGGSGATPTGGFNGGANGGSQNAGGGGGASDIRVNGTAAANRVIVAGGGGGGGRGGCESAVTIVGGNGGGGGGLSGSNGVDAPTSGGSAGAGQGGTISAGGAAGIGCGGFLGVAGVGGTAAGVGGSGGNGQSCCCFSNGSIPGGGGGGGGFVGGGGGGGGSAGTTACSGNDKGAGGGGAGGSNYTGGVTSASTTNATRTGNGVVKITYTVQPTPPVLTLSPTTFCVGSSGTISVANTAGTTYNWTVPAGLAINSGQGTNSINVNAASAVGGNVSVTATTVCGTSTATTYVVTINPAPNVQSTPSSVSNCIGDTIVFTASGAMTYSWSTGGSGTTETVIPTSSTTVFLTGTDANGCQASVSIPVTVNPLPAITTSGNTSVCIGSSATLTATGGVNYLWSSGGTSSSEVVSPTVTTSYSVIGTDTNGCSSSDSLTVTVNPLPTVSAVAMMASVCAGSCDSLTASGASAYSWSSGGSAATEVVCPTSTTTYTVTGTDGFGCSSSDTVSVNVNALPNVTLTLSTNSVCVTDGPLALTGGTPSGGTYSGPGVTGSNFSASAAGTGAHSITYTFTNASGCTSSASQTITVNACVGIVNPAEPNSFQFAPNPVKDILNLRWGSNVNVTFINVLDVTGRVVMSQEVNGVNNLELNVSSLPVGSYNLQVMNGTAVSNYRFVKQ